jgi:hypothetical protein
MRAFRGVNLSSRSGLDSDDPLWHLANIVGAFDALLNVFEKQTKSPSIKSCYDLQDLASGGVFVLRTFDNLNEALVVITPGMLDSAFCLKALCLICLSSSVMHHFPNSEVYR